MHDPLKACITNLDAHKLTHSGFKVVLTLLLNRYDVVLVHFLLSVRIHGVYVSKSEFFITGESAKL